MMVRIPRVFTLSILDTILEMIALGIVERNRLATRTDLERETVNDYLELARWLGWLEDEGVITLSEVGRRYVGDIEARDPMMRRALTSTPLLCRARAEEEWPEQPDRAIAEVVARDTTLDELEIQRRAEGIAELLDRVDASNRQTPPALPSLRDALPEPGSVPLDLFGIPDEAESLLETMEVNCVGDLLEVDPDGLRSNRDWDDAAIESLLERRSDARNLIEHPSEEWLELAGRLRRAGVDLQADWREVFIQLPTRAESGLARLELQTVGDVITAVLLGDLTHLTGIGPGTVRDVRDQFDIILEHGYDYYLYGPGGRPETISALADRMLDSLTEEDRTILEMRYLEGETFEAIGEAFELTRQRIRQKVQDYLKTLGAQYGELAESLTRSLIEALESGPGVLHRKRVVLLTGCSNLYRVLLVVLLNDEDAYLWHDHFIANIPSSRLERDIVARCRRGIADAHAMELSWNEGLRIARREGWILDKRGWRDLLRAIWEMDVDARGVFENRWTNKGDRIARVIKEARRAVDLETIAERYQARYATEAEAEATARRVQPFVKKHPDIYTIDNGEYIHEHALSLKRDFLERAVNWCVERLRGETSAVSVKGLLEQMGNSDLALESDLEGLNWYLLRDALLRHDDITGFHNTFNVAWEPTYEHEGVTLLDRVRSILRGTDAPMTARDVVEALPEDFEVNPHSVENYLISQPFSIKIEAHTYLHRNSLRLDEETLDRLVERAVMQLPEDGTVLSTTRLLEHLDGSDAFDPLLERDGASGILWGLLRHDERVQVGSRRLVARGEHRHDVLLERAILDVVDRIGPAYPREIDEALDTKFGFDIPESRVYRHARELADQGELRRFPNGLYFSMAIGEERLFEQLESRHDELTRSARRADMDRYPADDLGILARYLAHSGQFEAAERVLGVLRQQERPEAFREERGELYERVRHRLEQQGEARGPSESRPSAE